MWHLRHLQLGQLFLRLPKRVPACQTERHSYDASQLVAGQEASEQNRRAEPWASLAVGIVSH